MHSTVQRGRLMELALQGEPLSDVLVIDCHIHFGGGRSWTTFIPFGDAEGILAAMDCLGIDQACVSAFRALGGDPFRGNDEVLDLMEQYPDRFIGFAVFNPNYPTDGMAAELERCFQQGMRGIKIHPTTYVHDYSIDGSHYEPVWEFAKEHNCPVLTHAGPRTEIHRCGPALLDRVASRHPEVKLIIGHSGAYDSWDALDEHIAVVERHDNLYLDISAMGRFYRAIDYMVERVGSERVLMASDAPLHSIPAEFGHVVFARIPDSEKERILGQNIAGLLEAVH